MPSQTKVNAEGVEAEELRVKGPLDALSELLQTLPGADVCGHTGENGPALAAWLPRAQVFLNADEAEGHLDIELLGKPTDIAHMTGRLLWLGEPKAATAVHRLELSHPDGDRFWQGRADGWRFEQLSGKFGGKPRQKSQIFTSTTTPRTASMPIISMVGPKSSSRSYRMTF